MNEANGSLVDVWSVSFRSRQVRQKGVSGIATFETGADAPVLVEHLLGHGQASDLFFGGCGIFE